jgi:hypothetical protein
MGFSFTPLPFSNYHYNIFLPKSQPLYRINGTRKGFGGLHSVGKTEQI